MVARRIVALALLLACSVFSRTLWAEPAVTVLVLEPLAPDLLQRVQGQLADKSARVLAVRASGATAVARAFGAARAHQAEVVVWFSEREPLLVSVLDVRGSRLIERELGPAQSGEVMARSARDEAAAFMVRSAVEDIAEGRAIGRAVAAPPPAPVPCESTSPPPPPPPRWHALAAAYLVADGLESLRGPELGLLHQRSRLEVAALARISYDSRLERAGFSLDIARYDLRWLAAYNLLARRRVELSAGGWLGPSLHRRATRAVPAGYAVASSSLEPDFFVGALGAAAFRLTSSGLRLRITLGIEAGLGSRQLLVRGRADPLESAWRVQPLAELGLVLPLW